MELKNLFQNDDRAVSPVIGVILMVAITVILAAVIGTFVLGLGDDIGTEVNAGVTVDQSGGETTVTWTSQGTADNITFGGSNSTDWDPETIENVGDTSTNDNLTSGATFTIIAEKESGERTVIRTVQVNDAGAKAE